jgi:cystathionine beta-lyase/cystathionine gamma-synthase
MVSGMSDKAGKVRRQGEAVGGDYAVTGTLPTLDDVIAFKEGTAEFDHGYYRFVSHPRLRRLENELKARFGARHCRLTESPQTALLELILCLHKPGVACRIIILEGQGAAQELFSEAFIPPCEREGISVLPGDDGSALSDLGRGDILLVAGSGADAARAAEAAQAQGATVVAVSESVGGELPSGPAVPGARFHVLGLQGGQDSQGSVHAGAVLGNADRVMDALALQMKRRGPTLSSRAAECLAGGAPRPCGGATVAAAVGAPARVSETLSRMEGGNRAFLYASGMSAITRVLDLVRRPGRSRIIAVGHLYNDTYQTLRLGPNLFLGVDELDSLETRMSDQTAAILTETITNPLSDVPDLELLSKVARSHGVPLLVDNTFATPSNCNPFDFGADLIIHSTTKYLNGQNDHAGGAVIVKDGELSAKLGDYQALLHDQMSPLEAATLEQNLETFPERICRFNANAGKVASFLAGHRAVAQVFFNGLLSHRSYATARRLLRGTGSVISFTLARNTLDGLRAFYDSKLYGIVKAPSLGSDVTLLCPYTLLTHYDDTDEQLAEIGLPRFLLRVSVGCEKEISPVLESLDAALSNLKA